MNGQKHDQGKLRFDLIDPWFTRLMAEVMTHGAEKYAPNNWQHVEDFEARYTAALERHWNDYRLGHTIDSDSDCNLLAMVAVNAMFLAWKQRNKNERIKHIDVSRPEDNNNASSDEPVGYCNERGQTYAASFVGRDCEKYGNTLAVPDEGRAHKHP